MNSKVILRWDVNSTKALPPSVMDRFRERYRNRITKEGELVLTSSRFRDQGRNVADVLNKLRQMVLEVAEPPKTRKKTKPPAAARKKRLRDKREQSRKKEDRKPPRME